MQHNNGCLDFYSTTVASDANNTKKSSKVVITHAEVGHASPFTSAMRNRLPHHIHDLPDLPVCTSVNKSPSYWLMEVRTCVQGWGPRAHPSGSWMVRAHWGGNICISSPCFTGAGMGCDGLNCQPINGKCVHAFITRVLYVHVREL